MSESKIHAFDLLAPDYDAWFEQEGRSMFVSEVDALKQILPSLPRPWIEVGAGSGRFAAALGIDIGLDPSSRLIERARNRGVSVLLGRGEQIAFRTGAFGAVLLIATLCFLDSPGRTLTEAARVLRSNGKLALGAVLREGPWGQLYEVKKAAGHPLYRYAVFHSYAAVETLLMHTGFSIERVVSTLFQRPGRVNHIEVPREGFSADAGFAVILARKTSG
jgi:SAM-dependent methyltransferase